MILVEMEGVLLVWSVGFLFEMSDHLLCCLVLPPILVVYPTGDLLHALLARLYLIVSIYFLFGFGHQNLG